MCCILPLAAWGAEMNAIEMQMERDKFRAWEDAIWDNNPSTFVQDQYWTRDYRGAHRHLCELIELLENNAYFKWESP